MNRNVLYIPGNFRYASFSLFSKYILAKAVAVLFLPMNIYRINILCRKTFTESAILVNKHLQNQHTLSTNIYRINNPCQQAFTELTHFANKHLQNQHTLPTNIYRINTLCQQTFTELTLFANSYLEN